jgi:ApaG protein
MKTAVTEGVRISVEVKFQPDYKFPGGGPYLFAYFVEIKNENDFGIQLLHRHWKIFDSNGTYRFVDGPGVVGQQPELKPGSSYKYNSACDLISGIGYMEGHYVMHRIDNHRIFNVEIPRFHLELPVSLN